MLKFRGFRPCALLMLVAAGFGTSASHAQPFPSNTIRIVVPVDAGPRSLIYEPVDAFQFLGRARLRPSLPPRLGRSLALPGRSDRISGHVDDGKTGVMGKPVSVSMPRRGIPEDENGAGKR